MQLEKFDELSSRNLTVTPAQAGVRVSGTSVALDSRLRGNDEP